MIPVTIVWNNSFLPWTHLNCLNAWQGPLIVRDLPWSWFTQMVSVSFLILPYSTISWLSMTYPLFQTNLIKYCKKKRRYINENSSPSFKNCISMLPSLTSSYSDDLVDNLNSNIFLQAKRTLEKCCLCYSPEKRMPYGWPQLVENKFHLHHDIYKESFHAYNLTLNIWKRLFILQYH
jgi:hypothetical protein